MTMLASHSILWYKIGNKIQTGFEPGFPIRSSYHRAAGVLGNGGATDTVLFLGWIFLYGREMCTNNDLTFRQVF